MILILPYLGFSCRIWQISRATEEITHNNKNIERIHMRYSAEITAKCG